MSLAYFILLRTGLIFFLFASFFFSFQNVQQTWTTLVSLETFGDPSSYRSCLVI